MLGVKRTELRVVALLGAAIPASANVVASVTTPSLVARCTCAPSLFRDTLY